MEIPDAARVYPISPEKGEFEMTEAPTIEEMMQQLPPIPEQLGGDPVSPNIKRVVENKRRQILKESAGRPYALLLADAVSWNLLEEAMAIAAVMPRPK